MQESATVCICVYYSTYLETSSPVWHACNRNTTHPLPEVQFKAFDTVSRIIWTHYLHASNFFFLPSISSSQSVRRELKSCCRETFVCVPLRLKWFSSVYVQCVFNNLFPECVLFAVIDWLNVCESIYVDSSL